MTEGVTLGDYSAQRSPNKQLSAHVISAQLAVQERTIVITCHRSSRVAESPSTGWLAAILEEERIECPAHIINAQETLITSVANEGAETIGVSVVIVNTLTGYRSPARFLVMKGKTE